MTDFGGPPGTRWAQRLVGLGAPELSMVQEPVWTQTHHGTLYSFVWDFLYAVGHRGLQSSGREVLFAGSSNESITDIHPTSF